MAGNGREQIREAPSQGRGEGGSPEPPPASTERRDTKSSSRPTSVRNRPFVSEGRNRGGVLVQPPSGRAQEKVRPVRVVGETRPLTPAKPQAADRSQERRREQPPTQRKQGRRDYQSPPPRTRETGGSAAWTGRGPIGPAAGLEGWRNRGEQTQPHGHTFTEARSVLDRLGNPFAGS